MEIYYEPTLSETFLGVIKCWEDGRTLVASSNLDGRYWGGRLCCFSNPDAAVTIEAPLAQIEPECDIVDVLCLKGGRAVIGLDSGGIDVYQLNKESEATFSILSSCREHWDVVTSLSLTCDNLKFASSSFDKSIKIWDIATWASISTFRPIHNGFVYQVACSTTDPSVLLTCGQDGKILLIDLRLPKPASVLDCDEFVPKPAIAWKPKSNTVFAVGDKNGCISVQDIRKMGDKLQQKEHDRPIFKLAFSPSNPSWLASCADSTSVIVTDISGDNANIIYYDDSHEDLLRGLTWTPDNELLTCGHDRKIIKHVIKSSKTTLPLENGCQK